MKRNFFRIPHKGDCYVTWETLEMTQNGWQPVSVDRLAPFTAICEDEEGKSIAVKEDLTENFTTFTDLSAGKKLFIYLKGKTPEGEVLQSDTARIMLGRTLAQDGEGFVWHHYFPLNGRILMWMVGQKKYFDNATFAGQIAFTLIWNFLLAGLVIWGLYARKHLSLRRVFPFDRGIIIGGYDAIYQRNISSKFDKEIVEKWRNIVDESNAFMRNKINNSQSANIESIKNLNTQFWLEKGSAEIGGLLEKIQKSGLDDYPSVRIIQAGLENHELGGYHWSQVSQEVDRAIESRAASELEKIRRKSLLDWIWNLSTLSPLVGLFGTATGISNAFSKLEFLPADTSQTDLIKTLAGGIYEALWTTIEGLSVGIFMMILYYYYHNKLNWIYSKWEEIYVHVSEKL